MVTRHIGGESGNRGFFGGTKNTTRAVGLTVSVLLGAFLIVTIGWPGFFIGAVLTLVVLVATIGTHRGSVLHRRIKKLRWRQRQKSGTDQFVPWSEETWTTAQSEAAKARDKHEAAKILGSVRCRPDGADGMGWLEARNGRPGIAWHAPEGEEAYLSVAFEVRGQLRGAESEQQQNFAQEAFGRLLVDHAHKGSLIRRIQVLTRVLPPDMALYETWVANHLDPEAHPVAVESYQEVLDRTGRGAFIHRHIIVAIWPLSADFRAAADHYGEGRDGWRSLMHHQIRLFIRDLQQAQMGMSRAMTARGVVAMMLHQQNPSRPPLMVSDVDSKRMGLPSLDRWGSTWNFGIDPETGQEVVWGHRTARIASGEMENGSRSPYWLLTLLHNAGSAVRTLSFHHELIPAEEARHLASQDLTRDTADALARAEEGRLSSSETDMNVAASRARKEDLVHGSGHHGDNWVGYITVSAQSEADLVIACDTLAQIARNAAGIQRLDWMDTYQSAAAGTTWPIGRGLKPASTSIGTRMKDRLAGRESKEERVA